MQSETEASIALINAEAKREAAVIVNQATVTPIPLHPHPYARPLHDRCRTVT